MKQILLIRHLFQRDIVAIGMLRLELLGKRPCIGAGAADAVQGTVGGHDCETDGDAQLAQEKEILEGC